MDSRLTIFNFRFSNATVVRFKLPAASGAIHFVNQKKLNQKHKTQAHQTDGGQIATHKLKIENRNRKIP